MLNPFDLQQDNRVVEVAKDYNEFEEKLSVFVLFLKEKRESNDYAILCVTQKMIHNFLINNIKYSQEYNSKNPNRNYEKLLETISQDQFDNKKGCDAGGIFIENL